MKSKSMFNSIALFLFLAVFITALEAKASEIGSSGSTISISSQLTVAQNLPDTAPSAVEAIDLGLSVKWASFNVGASKPEEYGVLFGWADVTGNKTSTSNDDYPSANPPKNISGTEYDAAHVHWGGSWRLPTRDEQLELVEDCAWEKAKLNGVEGYRVTGKNGNSIFLAASGGRIGTRLLYQVSGGDFWSGTLSDNTDEAHYMWFYGGRQAVEDLPRHYGFAIRPVTE
jgi:hypothetical protein